MPFTETQSYILDAIARDTDLDYDALLSFCESGDVFVSASYAISELHLQPGTLAEARKKLHKLVDAVLDFNIEQAE